jgi:hypothetical protein
MTLNQILPFVSSVIMLIFTLSVFQRYLVRRRLHFLFWAIGLAMFGAGSFAEAYFAVSGWSATIFFIWYLFGAALNAAWIGHGSLLLLVRKRWVHVLTGLLIVGSVIAAVLMVQALSKANAAAYVSGVPISEQYRNVMPPIGQGGTVRLTTPFFNIYGLLTLVGGALWSAWLFLRKQVLPNRVIGNVLIAAGALSIGFASALTRVGNGSFLYLGELVAAVLMYAGFVMAAAPGTEAEAAGAAQQATAA